MQIVFGRTVLTVILAGFGRAVLSLPLAMQVVGIPQHISTVVQTRAGSTMLLMKIVLLRLSSKTGSTNLLRDPNPKPLVGFNTTSRY